MKSDSEKTQEQKTGHADYVRPALAPMGKLREITFECPQWQCSVTVPPPPEP